MHLESESKQDDTEGPKMTNDAAGTDAEKALSLCVGGMPHLCVRLDHIVQLQNQRQRVQLLVIKPDCLGQTTDSTIETK